METDQYKTSEKVRVWNGIDRTLKSTWELVSIAENARTEKRYSEAKEYYERAIDEIDELLHTDIVRQVVGKVNGFGSEQTIKTPWTWKRGNSPFYIPEKAIKTSLYGLSVARDEYEILKQKMQKKLRGNLFKRAFSKN